MSFSTDTSGESAIFDKLDLGTVQAHLLVFSVAALVYVNSMYGELMYDDHGQRELL
jgi:hypothetical protein